MSTTRPSRIDRSAANATRDASQPTPPLAQASLRAGPDETHLVEVVRPIGRRQEEAEAELSDGAALVLNDDAGVVDVVAVFQVAGRAVALAPYHIAPARHPHRPRARGADA